MRQVVQNYKTGELKIEEVPSPALRPGGILVRNSFSVISSGTERDKIQLGRKSLLGKARARPDQVKQVIQSARREGLWRTYKKAMNKLDTLTPLGYSCAGRVIQVGAGAEEFQPGDRVACAGGGYANHAEIVFVPKNLCARLPQDLPLDQAAFATLGAIAMQGIRRAEVTLGENVVVMGLGLLGQLTVQLLQAAGCRVFGIDLKEELLKLALELGADDGAVAGVEQMASKVEIFTGGRGADAVIITAATASSEPVKLAGQLARDRGRVVVVGAVDMAIPRKDYYEKELSLRLSRSYGPGRYDSWYEEKGVDYPIGYVRWTERRNMEEFLRLLSKGEVHLERIITHRYPIESALEAYELISSPGEKFFLGVLLQYEQRDTPFRGKLATSVSESPPPKDKLAIGFIGAGSFAQATLLPNLARIPSIRFAVVADALGTTSRRVADKYGFATCTTDYREVLQDPAVDCVFIATRHNLHAPMAQEALQCGKTVFLEKPMAMEMGELRKLAKAYGKASAWLMVGFNRRFAPLVLRAKEFLAAARGPLAITYRVNAGPIASDHWIQDPQEGGGRIIGEVCHFVDLIHFLADSKPKRVFAQALTEMAAQRVSPDNVVVTIELIDGSVGTIQYLSTGDPSFPKEHIEIFGRGSVAVIDDFKTLTMSRGGKRRLLRRREQDKGHREELRAFVAALREGRESPIPFEDALWATLVTFQTVEALRAGQPRKVDISQIVDQ
jgi:predicted dehydrogenase/threonine dehydrogenase-like Zn-dependent dehydrogenase